MNCPELQIISEFADGELEPNHAAEVERHLAQCISCQRSLEEMRSLEKLGRAAVEAVPVEETATPTVIHLKPLWLRWARPMSLAAAAVVAIFIGARLAFNHASNRQTASTLHHAAGAGDRSEQSEDAAFAQWMEPYRNLNIPLVPMDVAAHYDPPPILPTRPDNIQRN